MAVKIDTLVTVPPHLAIAAGLGRKAILLINGEFRAETTRCSKCDHLLHDGSVRLEFMTDDVAQIETWIRSLNIGTVSRESYRRNISVLLEFGRRRGYLRANPAADIKIRRRPDGEVSILTPDELRNLLSKCAPEIVPYVAIRAFAGLRPSEAASLLWSDIHLDTMQLEVRARHSKTRWYRLVPIQPNLGEWLMPFRSERGTIYYSRRKFREAYGAAGMNEWKMDILRHSYGTYCLPILKSADAE